MVYAEFLQKKFPTVISIIYVDISPLYVPYNALLDCAGGSRRNTGIREY